MEHEEEEMGVTPKTYTGYVSPTDFFFLFYYNSTSGRDAHLEG